MAKKASHTGFRNGDLFCFNCGTSYKLNLPQPISMAAVMMKQFDKDHKNCPKIWEEPKPNPDLSNSNIAIRKNADWWWNFGERGASSECMYNCLLKGVCDGNHPHDPGDFKRCYGLIQCVPQWKTELHKMKEVSEVWSKIIDNWDTLCEMLENALKTPKQEAPEMYALMKQIGC